MRDFTGMKFEVQVRTILQHAWAEIEHDRNYKFAGVLPSEIERNFNLLAGTLEIVDNEFERISKEIDKYSEEISDRTKRGKLDISINTTSLKQYLSEKIVSPFISPGFGAGQRRIVEELNIVGINTLEQLDKIISQDFIDEYVATLQKLNVGDNYTSFLRHLMMIKFTDKYFKKAWRRSFNLDDGDLRILSSFGVVPYKR
jgi:putative GTP pyrophosphokinase